MSDGDDDGKAADGGTNYQVDVAHIHPVQNLPDLPVSEYAERARYIPLRLAFEERKLLRLLESALNVSEYTDKVDIIFGKRSQRIHAQIMDVCAILSGLVVASDYKKGQALVQGRSFVDNAAFFQDAFELGRRHKIMNPEKMRSDYGKLMYLLQDSVLPEIQELLEFRCVIPIKTVHARLSAGGAAAMLDDPLVEVATRAIVPYTKEGREKSRPEVRREVKAKENAVETLVRRYATANRMKLGEGLSADDLRTCLYSIGDNNSFLVSNRDPVDQMITYLTTFFSPDKFDPGSSLAIHGGREGARLTHNHERQYRYVLQSLSLWRDILHDMFKLWYAADEDLLAERNHYALRDTGQGLNRVQAAPSVSRSIQRILYNMQRRVGGDWVGSSVIHLGDHNVPNALIFIDKYTQVSRILNPVIITLDRLDALRRDEGVASYIDSTFGGAERLRKLILTDFFRHAFDGSGADNFFDAGSCIDGRLTSAWNWCNQLEKKPYYHVFLLAGFSGFDGSFNK
eukprot:jgi/Mesvir1/5936/Mv00701-RA.2